MIIQFVLNFFIFFLYCLNIKQYSVIIFFYILFFIQNLAFIHVFFLLEIRYLIFYVLNILIEALCCFQIIILTFQIDFLNIFNYIIFCMGYFLLKQSYCFNISIIYSSFSFQFYKIIVYIEFSISYFIFKTDKPLQVLFVSFNVISLSLSFTFSSFAATLYSNYSNLI
ncbi:hypothetical protein IMG5_000920 [Ichthyophthirius multifiliis]|uniref:Transmembrane protein n=1 Tax=Ichthyophthirius multifiliis TaxID=5932 RepID=G0QIX9_ICHMU|nr:hypothetical protein IMG5_000920 [Ichthyophthirius multifiliis]EGR34864.1 hypothetical protein IMG5_000920 [Ichthyophthirius multifiliis]|eukprot:XP_004040168.1 hypothetical protein IMG5_000920 [Ichthyophthirius multifiliis]